MRAEAKYFARNDLVAPVRLGDRGRSTRLVNQSRGNAMRKSTSLFVAGLWLVAACGGSSATEGTIEITANDYSFAGVPETVAAGSELTLTNASAAEAHELVVMNIADDEARA